MANIRNVIQNLTPRSRAMLAVSAVGVLLVGYLMISLAGRKSYSTMLTGLNPAQTGKITAALDQQGIPYEIQNNGTALAVDSGKTAQARIALSEAGLPGEGQPGFEIFDKQKLGTSSFQQQVNYQRALEGEIARTIEQMDGIAAAQVQLVLPQDQVFAQEQSPASAGVLLTTGANGIDPGAVRGIAQLVASSVKGLKPQGVTITDQTGALLWPSGEGAGGGAGVASKQVAQAKYNQQLQQSLNALLVQTIGPGKGQVQVNADLNVDEATKDELVYAKKGVPLHSTEEMETLKGGGGTPPPSGTQSNIPTYAQGGAGGGSNSNYKRSSTQTDWGVNKTVTRTKIAPGQVNHLSVALVVDQSVPKPQVAALRNAVASAAGIQASRGDTLTVSQVAFAKPPAAPAAGPLGGGIMGYARWAVLALGTLLFLFFMRRHLRRREGEALEREPTWLREIQAPRSLAQIEQELPTRPLATPKPDPARLQVEEYAQREPERVAQQVRHWLKED